MFRSSLQASNAAQDPHKINEKILLAAKRSGVISLSARGLSYVPPAIWTLNDLNSGENNPIYFGADGNDEIKWWEVEPITKLNLFGNSISEIPGDGIAKLDSLVIIDLRDNELTTLPNEISALVNLKQLLLSSNKIATLPNALSKLSSLVHLNLAHNELIALPDDMANLESLEKLDVSDNKLTQVPPTMPPSLISLELSQNKLSILPPGWIQSCPHLQELNISNNQLEDVGITSEPALLSLTLLNLHKNYLREIPKLAVFPKLIDLYLGDNRIETFCLEKFDGLKSLSTLELSRNRISSVPDDIPNILPKLCRLNLSSNDIKYVPTDLGLMESLEVLQLSANPLRSIPQDVLSSGTRALKELLSDRHEPMKKPISLQSPTKEETKAVAEPLQSSPYDYLSVLNTSTGVLNWGQDKKQTAGNRFARDFTMNPADQTLPPLDDEDAWKSVALKDCKPDALVRTVILSSRQLNQFPLGVLAFRSSLTELNLSHNKLTKLPEEIGLLNKLENLDVSFNALTALPEALSHLSCLATLKIDFNSGLGPELPYSILFEEPLRRSLREISAAGCRLTRLPPAELISKDRMPQLTSFDVSDNNIDALQPELGLCTQIQNLHLSGNSFRIPRPNIVCKGTAAVLEYLRLRIAQ